MTTYTYSGGMIASLVVLAIVVALPVKLAAHLAGATRTGLLWCIGAMVVGMFTGSLAASIAGGAIGGPLAGYIGFVIGIRLMLGTSLLGAFGLSIIAAGLSIAGFFLLAHLGIIHSTTSMAVAI